MVLLSLHCERNKDIRKYNSSMITIEDLHGKYAVENVNKIGDRYNVSIDTNTHRIEVQNVRQSNERYVFYGYDAIAAMKDICDICNAEGKDIENGIATWIGYCLV